MPRRRARLGFERSTTDWREVLADPEVQAISVTTPNDLHKEIVLAAAKGGKHVFCEKPVGRSPQETAEIARAAREAKILNWVGFNYRWAPLAQFARQLVADGALGALTNYRGRFFVDYGSNPNGAPWGGRHGAGGAMGPPMFVRTHAQFRMRSSRPSLLSDIVAGRTTRGEARRITPAFRANAAGLVDSAFTALPASRFVT